MRTFCTRPTTVRSFALSTAFAASPSGPSGADRTIAPSAPVDTSVFTSFSFPARVPSGSGGGLLLQDQSDRDEVDAERRLQQRVHDGASLDLVASRRGDFEVVVGQLLVNEHPSEEA